MKFEKFRNDINNLVQEKMEINFAEFNKALKLGDEKKSKRMFDDVIKQIVPNFLRKNKINKKDLEMFTRKFEEEKHNYQAIFSNMYCDGSKFYGLCALELNVCEYFIKLNEKLNKVALNPNKSIYNICKKSEDYENENIL